MDSLDDLLHIAREAAEAAAEVHRRRTDRPSPEAWTEKGHSDWVSDVDHAAEEAAVALIRSQLPEHAIAAEESDWGGPAPAEAPVTWYIDPLDGTTNYLHHYPFHAASIAAVDREGLAAAVVINSASWEIFEAKRGGGATRDGHGIAISEVSHLKHALIGTGFPFKKTELLDDYLRQFRALLPQTSGIRRTGSAAIDLCDVACGRLDGFWELHLAPWDMAAGTLILREAGGIATDMEGDEDVIKHGGMIAGAPAIYSKLRGVLEQHR